MAQVNTSKAKNKYRNVEKRKFKKFNWNRKEKKINYEFPDDSTGSFIDDESNVKNAALSKSGKKNSKQNVGFGAEEKIIFDKSKIVSDKRNKSIIRKEERRVRRIKVKMQQTVCYCCRKKGHTLANCKRNNDSQKLGVCFKCGSLEHTLKNCKSKANGLPYAYCFVCNGHGHLAKSCKENPNGIYPNGGSCKKCGSIYHLVKDCEKHNNESSVVAASKLATFESADADLSPIKCGKKSAKREKITVHVKYRQKKESTTE
ncbi:Zinc finger CCHC domain-containing protein 9 [Trichinella zimbabwensis]|uniref:Zinc finger CCHC domain-containing protein 9 n=1 Tax=Trichinella zimbabwensis TaxID=268475 RepID=A0A0V1I741_9BILA|nr:Zinc finger CCHC domain-containing protein 9 [Trichinella zimbabwensis]